MSELVRMHVRGLMLDPSTNSPIVVLRHEESDLFLPIWIGVFEASAIQLTLEGVTPERPLTHDLLISTLNKLGFELTRVVVCDLKENTFFAQLHVEQEDRQFLIDSRPSDALALALRTEAPVFVEQDVLDAAHAADLTKSAEEDKLKKWFEELSPEDLGKYTM